MCLAVPGRIISVKNDNALVDFQGNRLDVCSVLTPEVEVGDWVLVHAGFAITRISERAALETWSYLRGDPGAMTDAAEAMGVGGG